jgi:hypothetical protein
MSGLHNESATRFNIFSEGQGGVFLTIMRIATISKSDKPIPLQEKQHFAISGVSAPGWGIRDDHEELYCSTTPKGKYY